MIGGVVFQVTNMLVCSGVMLAFWRRYQRAAKKAAEHRNSEYTEDKARDPKVRGRFVWFVRAASFAFVAVLIRCIYRVAEMAGGWANPIMRDETTFIVLDSTYVFPSSF